MKRFSIFILIFFTMLAFLTSCSLTSSGNPSEGTTASPQTDQTTITTNTQGASDAEIPDGSFSTDDYTVSKVNDTYYLNFADGNTLDSNGGDHYISDSSVYFDSLAEMKEKITTNTLDKADLAVIKSSFPKDENGILMINLNHLYQPIAPSEYTFPSIIWDGHTYGGTLIPQGTEVQTWGFWKALSTGQYEDAYSAAFDKYIQDYKEDESKELLSHEESTWNGLPCDIYVLKTSVARLRVIQIHMPAEDGEEPLHISLSYTIEYSGTSSDVDVSETVPYRGYLFGKMHGQYYQITLHDFTEAPTVEWLTSFGVTPYVDDTDHVVS